MVPYCHPLLVSDIEGTLLDNHHAPYTRGALDRRTVVRMEMRLEMPKFLEMPIFFGIFFWKKGNAKNFGNAEMRLEMPGTKRMLLQVWPGRHRIVPWSLGQKRGPLQRARSATPSYRP